MAADLGSRVLIADGDSAWRQRLFSRLLELDIFSDCVTNGQDAMRQLADLRYNVLVLDLGLSGDAMQVLRDVAAMKRPPLVLATAGEEAARALDLDIVQIVLRKPVDVNQVAELIRNCVRTMSNPRGVALPPETHGEDRLRS